MSDTQDLRRHNRVKRSEQQPCFVCGKHKSITHAHHVLPLNECVAYMDLLDTSTIECPIIWLCPNCHSYYHKIFSKHFSMDNYWLAIEEIGKEQADKIVEIEKFKDNIDHKYFKIFDQMINKQA